MVFYERRDIAASTCLDVSGCQRNNLFFTLRNRLIRPRESGNKWKRKSRAVFQVRQSLLLSLRSDIAYPKLLADSTRFELLPLSLLSQVVRIFPQFWILLDCFFFYLLLLRYHTFSINTFLTIQKKRSDYSERFAYPGNDLSFQQKNSKYFQR